MVSKIDNTKIDHDLFLIVLGSHGLSQQIRGLTDVHRAAQFSKGLILPWLLKRRIC